MPPARFCLRTGFFRRAVAAGLLAMGCGGSLPSARAQVILNELVADTNERGTMADDRGRMRPGTGAFWADAGFSAPGWQTGTAPFGFGGAAGLGTNVASRMQNRTPNLYIRRSFDLTPAQAADEGQLVLRVRFDDGFIAFLNGREVARSNTGPAGHFVYADQTAYNFAAARSDSAYTPNSQPGTVPTAPSGGVTYTLGKVADFLTAGENVLAVQLVNREPNISARIDAQLEIITATAVLDVVRHSFNDANDSAILHRNAGGAVTSTTEGTVPAGSWLALAPPAVSSPAWQDLTLRQALVAGQGIESSGALRISHSQTDAVNQPASVSGPPLSLASRFTPGSLTEADLANLGLTFRFRATAGTDWAVRLDPEGAGLGASLAGLPALTPTAGTAPGTTQGMPDGFDDAAGGLRTRTVSATGSASTTTTGLMRNTFNFYQGPAMRDAVYTLLENNAAGSGTGTVPGSLEFTVVKAPVEPDWVAFYYQDSVSLAIRSWTAGAITPAHLKNGAVQFDWNLPAGVEFQVYLEPAISTSSAADRLGLGTITGTGSWQTSTLDTSAGTNQTAFLNYLNTFSSVNVRLLFQSSAPLPEGTRLQLDNIGYVPWRTYTAAFSSGQNAAAFLAALNAQPSLRFFPVLEKNGAAIAPAAATVTLDELAVTLTKPNAGIPAVFVPYAATGWSWFPGLAEPSGGLVEPADFVPAGGKGKFLDWIELLNTGATPVDLAGWSLTDDPLAPEKYVFPAGTSLAPGAVLVVAADGRAAAPAGAAWLHAPFSLAAAGEYLGLYDAAGTVIDALDPGYPPQNSFHSWGRDPASGQWGFFRTASPGIPNSGGWQAGQAVPPVFSVAGGFHTGPVTLALSTGTPGATIRYTLDGSDPEAGTGALYTGPLSLNYLSDRIGHAVKARSFAPGLLPSAPVTHTYLINQNTNLRQNPAVLLTGDPGRTFYKPQGIFAIQGGTYSDSLWTARGPNDYNIPVGDGRLTDPATGSRPYERPVFLEYYYPDNRPGIREAAGVRVSSSPWSRPRLVLSDPPNRTLWNADPTLKPSLNIFFRGDYGNSSISHPLIPETEVRTFEEFRLRAGKNDISNPFIRDEFVRRLYTDMGHQGSVGTFASVYINGYFKGYYNLVERIREAFMQNHYRSSAKWDVNYIGVFENGDAIHWNSVLQPRLTASLTTQTGWNNLRQVLDVENVADYFLLNIWAAMWDWPHNNWGMARERSGTGLWRCYVWDAEGGLNLGGRGPDYQTLRDDLLSSGATTPLPSMFRRLMTSPEFRLLFADRVNRHLFNNGALTDARTGLRRSATQAEVSRLMAIAGITPDTSWYTNWISPSSGRRRYLFPFRNPGESGYQAGQLRDPDQNGNLADTLWPLTLPPVFSQHGGVVTPGSLLTITHTAPANSMIYYTLDGTDPRLFGGAVASGALTYSAAVPLPQTTTVLKARVRNGTTSEWSPLTEAKFALATVPATAANTVVAEIMYNPPGLTTAEAAAGFTDKEDFEYIVIRNIGPAPSDISGLAFTAGISFSFSSSSRRLLDPGQRCLLARNATALRFRYGAAIDTVLGGEYSGALNNAGEALNLQTAATGEPVKAFLYSDDLPWPAAADGYGASLMLISPESNPDHGLAASWRNAPSLGGTPAGTALNLTYAQWSAWVFTAGEQADPVRTGPLADFDGDGWPNAMEFLTGTDPRSALSSPAWQWEAVPAGDPGGGTMLRVFLPVAPGTGGMTLEPQATTDPAGWQNGFTLVQSVPQPDGTVRQTWEKTVPAPASRQFLRLRLTTP